ncbi:hypothetical protein AtubIFM57258_001115 [Aspergillus tubingensis]|nr:hypothetical protein AtubIFM57258_001115 [Aspergillus tubingensis]
MVSLLRIGNRRATPWSTLRCERQCYDLSIYQTPTSSLAITGNRYVEIMIQIHREKLLLLSFCVETKIDTEQGPLRNLHLAALMLRGLRYFYQKAYGKNDEADKFDGKVRVLMATISRSDVNVFGHWTNSHPGDPNVTYEHFLIKKWHFEETEELYVARHGLETLCKWIVSGLQELAKA